MNTDLSKAIVQSINKFAIVSFSDLMGNITYVNDRFVEFSGYSKDEIIGNSHSILNSGFHKKEYFNKLWTTILSGKSFHGLTRNKSKSGNFYWVDVHIYPLFDSNNNVTSFVSIRYPVSELKVDHKHWREESINKSLLNEFLTISVNTTDYDTLFKEAIDLLQSSPFSSILPGAGIFVVENDELILKYHKSLHKEIVKQCATIKKGECHCGMAFRAKRSQYSMCVDHKHTVTYKGMTDHGHYNVPILYQKEVIGVIVLYLPKGHIKNISEISFIETMANALALSIIRIKNIESLKEEKKVAEKALLANTKYLSMMSHEVRTPLNGVVGIANLLKSGSIVDKNEIEEIYKTLQYSASNLMTLVNDVLDFAKLDAGKIEIENTNFNFYQFFKELKNIFSIKCNEKGLEFLTEKDKGIPENLNGDITRLNQVVLNITNNAVKFTERGSVKVSANIINNDNNIIKIRFKITDTGIGIAEENFDKIFNQYEQAEIETTRKYGGTGLGLSIAKQIINLQNSEIIIESELGKGSTFYFDLNFEKAESINNSDDFDISSASLKGIKILVAEDNPINTLVLKGFLKIWNSNVDYVVNGIEVIEKIKVNKYDLILMDIQMPIMDGIEAASEIVNLGIKTPIIALTASRSGKEKFLINHSEFIDYVTKPFAPNIFFNIIKKALK